MSNIGSEKPFHKPHSRQRHELNIDKTKTTSQETKERWAKRLL